MLCEMTAGNLPCQARPTRPPATPYIVEVPSGPAGPERRLRRVFVGGFGHVHTLEFQKCYVCTVMYVPT